MTHWETFGAALAVVASVISNLGVNIQKYSHAQEAQVLPVARQRPYVQRPLWWLGLALVVLGSLGDFTAFGFATQSLVAALGGGSTLVANVFTAYFLNKEALYATDLGGVLFVIIGVVIIAWIAEPNVEYPLPELEERFLRTEFVVYIVAVGVCAVSMLATIKGSVANRLKNQVYWSKQRQKKRMKALEARIQQIERRLGTMETALLSQHPAEGGSSRPGVLHPSGMTARSASDAGDLTIGDDDHSVPNRVAYYYAICSGIVGAITVLLAKCSAIMIALSLKGENQFKYGLTYVFIGGMFVCILVQTHFLNMATALGDIMTVFPIFQACWITFSVIGGAIFYDSDRTLSQEELILYPTALLCIGIGVALLIQHPKASKNDGSHNGKVKFGGADDDELGGLLDDDAICMITDASMRSPLLPEGSTEAHDGYLHLDA
uniref:Magnesium transporter n=1 Tax=Globisporangium ultimum (strain ATCC 200006 / CBS 805.95 / DAOM BR144) TaxID=431595 RepID=K3X6H4_GLOUD